MTELDLNQLRIKIDDIDSQIAELFKQRMEIALEIGKFKQANGIPILNDKREKEILCNISMQIGAPLDEYAKLVFNTIFDVSKAYQSNYMKTTSVNL